MTHSGHIGETVIVYKNGIFKSFTNWTKLSLLIKLFADFAEEKDWMSFINTKV